MINTPGRDPVITETCRYFEFEHLPQHLQAVSRIFHDAAEDVLHLVREDSEQLKLALQRLVDAKDAAVRAALP